MSIHIIGNDALSTLIWVNLAIGQTAAKSPRLSAHVGCKLKNARSLRVLRHELGLVEMRDRAPILTDEGMIARWIETEGEGEMIGRQ
jgi:hypothetical protein